MLLLFMNRYSSADASANRSGGTDVMALYDTSLHHAMISNQYTRRAYKYCRAEGRANVFGDMSVMPFCVKVLARHAE